MICYVTIDPSALSLSLIYPRLFKRSWLCDCLIILIHKTRTNHSSQYITDNIQQKPHCWESATISRQPWIAKKVPCLWYLTWVQLSTQLTTPYYSIGSARVMVFRVTPYGGLWLVRLHQKTSRVTQECRRYPCWGQHCSHSMSYQSAMSSEDTASISPQRWRPAIDAYFWSESYIIIQSHTASSRLHNRNSGVAHRKLSQSKWSENWVPSDCACICKEIN